MDFRSVGGAALGGDQVQGVAPGAGVCCAADWALGGEEDTTRRSECSMFTRMDTPSEEDTRPHREGIP